MHVGMRSKLVSTTAMQASPTECHSWQGKEQWIAYKEFADALRSPPLDVLLNCESWQVFSNPGDNASVVQNLHRSPGYTQTSVP